MLILCWLTLAHFHPWKWDEDLWQILEGRCVQCAHAFTSKIQQNGYHQQSWLDVVRLETIQFGDVFLLRSMGDYGSEPASRSFSWKMSRAKVSSECITGTAKRLPGGPLSGWDWAGGGSECWSPQRPQNLWPLGFRGSSHTTARNSFDQLAGTSNLTAQI